MCFPEPSTESFALFASGPQRAANSQPRVHPDFDEAKVRKSPFRKANVSVFFRGLGCLLLLATLACSKPAPPPIAWQTDLDAALNRAQAQGRPAFIDFTAAWCAACQELERQTYVDPEVRRATQRFVAIKVDATVLDEAMQARMKVYRVESLPAVVFVDAKGTLRPTPRLTGFVPAARFVAMLGEVP
jgi:thiol:disulfide interchange protein